jgi:hypothetical protein
VPSRSRRQRQARPCLTEEPPDHPIGIAAGFGYFGTAVVRDIVSEDFVRRRLDDALQALLRSSELPPEYASAVTAAAVTDARLISEDDTERAFSVIVRVELEADVGPRLLALGVDARVEVGLTVRVRAFAPATVGFDIDRVTPDDVWFRTRARTDWLPFPLLAGGPSGLSRPAQRSAERAVPRLCDLVNEALETAEQQRRVDLLDWITRYAQRAPRGHTRHGPRKPRVGAAITFAELGTAVLRDGLNHRLVATALGAALTGPLEVELHDPMPVRGTVAARVTGVATMPGPPDERVFRVRLAADVDLVTGEEGAAVTGTVRAEVPLRMVTRVQPAMLVITFDPVRRLGVRRVRRAYRRWMMPVPVPNQSLAKVRRKVTEEVDRRLAETVVRVVAAELVDAVLPPRPPEASFGVRVEYGDDQSWPTAKPSSTSRLE